jgi:hypothetical protein
MLFYCLTEATCAGLDLAIRDRDGRDIYAPAHLCEECLQRQTATVQAKYRPEPEDQGRFCVRIWCGSCHRSGWRGDSLPDYREPRYPDGKRMYPVRQRFPFRGRR